MTDTAPTLFRTFVGKILMTRDAAHVAHWRAQGDGSYAAHVALDEFYNTILGKLDEIVEVYQGKFGLINAVPVGGSAMTSTEAIIDHISKECDWIADNRAAICGGNAALGNLLDELCAVYMKTLYKLRYLK